MRTRLTFQELEKFVDVSETLNFRASAARCCISQPALSRTIASAEAKLGTRLFDRNTRGVALTDAGEQLLPIARRILFELNGSLSELSQFVAGHRGHITIASIPSAAAALLPGPMRAYLQAHPGVSVELQSLGASEVIAAVASGSADFGISAFPHDGSDLPSEAFNLIPLFHDDLMLLCAEGDPFAREKTAPWSAFATRPYIANGAGSSIRAMVTRVLADVGVTSAPRYESMNLSVTARMVAAGLGIAVIASLSRGMINAGGLAFRPLADPVLSRSIAVLTRRGRSPSRSAQQFLEEFLKGRPTHPPMR